jgi:putative heme transporter
MSFSEPDTDILVPAFDVRALARRAAVPAAVAAAAAAALVVAGGPLHAFAHALRRAVDADPRWVIGGAIFELLSFAGYVALFWMVGSRASKRLGLSESTQVTLGGAAATRLLPTAGVGGAAVTLWSLRRSGMGAREATRTLLGFLIVLYSVFLAAIATSGGLIALGIASGDGPFALSAVPAAAATLGIAGSLALGARHARGARRAGRLGDAADVFGGAVRDAIGHVRSADPRLLGALAWWTFDASVLWAMLHAFGAPPPFAVVVLAYFVGQVGNTIPIPGAVSGGIVGVLVAFAVPADLALVSVLAYRAIAIWLPAPIGLVALGALRRTMTRWSAEDAAAAVAVGVEPHDAAPARPAQAPLPVSRAPRPCTEPALLAA